MNSIEKRLNRFQEQLGIERLNPPTVTFPARRRRLKIVPQELLDFADTAAPGEKLTYHVGFLALDRADFDAARPKTEEQRLTDALGVIAYSLHSVGKVALVQQKLGDCEYIYAMQKRHKPVERRTHAGCVE